MPTDMNVVSQHGIFLSQITGQSQIISIHINHIKVKYTNLNVSFVYIDTSHKVKYTNLNVAIVYIHTSRKGEIYQSQCGHCLYSFKPQR